MNLLAQVLFVIMLTLAGLVVALAAVILILEALG